MQQLLGAKFYLFKLNGYVHLLGISMVDARLTVIRTSFQRLSSLFEESLSFSISPSFDILNLFSKMETYSSNCKSISFLHLGLFYYTVTVYSFSLSWYQQWTDFLACRDGLAPLAIMRHGTGSPDATMLLWVGD